MRRRSYASCTPNGAGASGDIHPPQLPTFPEGLTPSIHSNPCTPLPHLSPEACSQAWVALFLCIHLTAGSESGSSFPLSFNLPFPRWASAGDPPRELKAYVSLNGSRPGESLKSFSLSMLHVLLCECNRSRRSIT